MLFSKFIELVPDSVCIEVIYPGEVPCSLSELGPDIKERVLDCDVIEVYPLAPDWLGVSVK